jgi:response regulator RpfG family c-di-GMP phosphodiesterase
MASLMHDLSLDENIYPNVEEWNKQAKNLSDRSPEIVRFRLHPLHASQTAQTIDVLPPDVEQIILQHHEAPDGSGFPRGLTANRIHYLSSVFIIAEDLVQFLADGEALETSLKDFLTWGENRYQQGNFKKIFDGMKAKMT